jgi:hypothetical protein
MFAGVKIPDGFPGVGVLAPDPPPPITTVIVPAGKIAEVV